MEQSTTPGMETITSSISLGLILLPPTLMISFFRAVRKK